MIDSGVCIGEIVRFIGYTGRDAGLTRNAHNKLKNTYAYVVRQTKKGSWELCFVGTQYKEAFPSNYFERVNND